MGKEYMMEPENFPKYPKINSLYKRDDRGNFTSTFSQEEFEYLYENKWIGTEKIHGTNIRLAWDSETGERHILGRGNNTQIPYPLGKVLNNIIHSVPFEEQFATANKVVLFGEGFGKGIQKPGADYRADGPDFILFDIWIDGWWLKREDVEHLGNQFNLGVVPLRFQGTLKQAENLVKGGLVSTVAENHKLPAEGLVLFPEVPLRTRKGDRVITKLKTEDYR